jgi:hypothetical protein
MWAAFLKVQLEGISEVGCKPRVTVGVVARGRQAGPGWERGKVLAVDVGKVIGTRRGVRDGVCGSCICELVADDTNV